MGRQTCHTGNTQVKVARLDKVKRRGIKHYQFCWFEVGTLGEMHTQTYSFCGLEADNALTSHVKIYQQWHVQLSRYSQILYSATTTALSRGRGQICVNFRNGKCQWTRWWVISPLRLNKNSLHSFHGQNWLNLSWPHVVRGVLSDCTLE